MSSPIPALASHETEERLRLAAVVFDQAREAILICDRDNRIATVNRAFTEITGYGADEVCGCDPKILSSGSHDNDFYLAMWASLREDGHWNGEIWNRRKSGETYPEWLSITIVRDGHGEVAYYVAIFSDITQVRRDKERLHRLAHHDALTNLPNRLLFRDRLEQALARAARHGKAVAVMMLDLDRFKEINDVFGHDVGDTLLQEVARRLLDCVRDADTVSRFGGDEFTLVLPDLDDGAGGHQTAQRIVAAFQRSFELAGQEVFVAPSIGVAAFPECGTDAETLLKVADLNMYEAKRGARSGIASSPATHGMSEESPQVSARRLALDSALHHALERRELRLHYQPMVHLETGRISGAEALLRWQRADGSMVPPAEFIPLAEQTGLIAPIGEWVIHEVCRQLRAWKDARLPALPVAINISPRQFRRQPLSQIIVRAVDLHGIVPKLLELELTESMLVDDPAAATNTLRELKAIGVGLALDDFGTGYSNLGYLKRYPLDKLKIDRSFVENVASDPNDAAIARAVIFLGRTLGLTVVAEGVETIAQLELLRRHGCDEMQGCYFSPAMTPDAYAAMLASGLRLEASQSDRSAERQPIVLDS
jgi:diguanylate cyclase (GGDEF)-like protein/PAS domain S-box-containing protein